MAQNRKRLFLSLLAMMLSVALMIGFTPGLYAFAAEASAEETVESGIKAIDLDLGNTIAVKLYTEAVENDGSKVVVAFGGEETEITAQKGGVFTFSGVAPQHMSDTLTATLYAADGTAVGASATFSVRSYLEALLLLDYENSGCKTTWQYTAMKELAVNLLNYGAAAQIYTDYNVDDLANKNLTDEQKALGTDTIAVSGSDKAVSGDSWVGAGVRFDYRLGIYFIFEAESLEGITASVNGNSVTPQLYNRAKNQYVIRYASFDATNMNSVITAKLNVGDTEETYAYSIKSYVAAKGGDNSALSELVNATYKYGFSAVAYAGDLVTVDPTFDTTGSASIDGKGYDFTGSAYGDVTLPKLSLADYTTSSSIDGESATPVVTTTYTLKGGAVKYSTTVESSDAIKVNGNIYSKYELSLLNNDEVEVTYDEENGYTYRAKTAQTLTSLAAYGNALTIIGDVTIVRDTADWNHYNALNIGTATEKANVTVNNAAGATRGITFRSAADMYVAEGSSFTVTKGGTYSVMAYEQGTTILVDGTMTVASKIRLEKAPAIDASYEYGFQPALYVRKGTVTVEAGQLISNSVQVGSERDGYKGTLNITQTAKGTNYATTSGKTENTICAENTGELVRYVFANGNVHLTDASTAALTGIDARTSASSYVEFGSGITFKTSGGYTYLLGCWSRGSDYRFSIHTDAKFDLTLSSDIIAVGYTASNHITYHSTALINVDGEMKIVRIAQDSASTAQRNIPQSVLAANGDGTSSIPDISYIEGAYATVADSTVSYGLAGEFAKATYTDEGGISYSLYYKVVAEHTHVVSKVDGKAATCTEKGIEDYYECSCGFIFSDAEAENRITAPVEIPVAPHTETTLPAVAATCTTAGLTEGKKCGVCEKILVAQTATEALGHTEVIDKAVAATCKDTGLTEGKHCSVCNEVLVAQTVTPTVSHTYDDEYDTTCNVCDFERDVACAHAETEELKAVAATCTTAGLTAGTKCKSCGEIIVPQETVKALGHTEVVDEAVAATCTTTGLTEGKHCSVCNEVLVAQLATDALGHTTVVDAAVAATCTTTGLTEGSHCSVCNEVFVAQEVVDATNHPNATFSEQIDATFESEGYVAYYACPDCNCFFADAEYTKSIVPFATPKLNLTDYTTYTKIPTFATKVSVTTEFTLVSDEVEYSVSLASTDILVVNRGDGNVGVTKYDYQKLNTDIVTVTYDSKGGYTYSVAEGETETGIIGAGIRSAGTIVTITGNVEISLTARWGHNNGLVIGTAEKPANVTFSCTATDGAFCLWDGADLTVNEGSTFIINSNYADSLWASAAGTHVIVDGTLICDKTMLFVSPSQPEWVSQSSDGYNVNPELYVRKGTVTIKSGQLLTNTLQVGSVKDGHYGTLNITQDTKHDSTYSNTINSRNQKGSLRYIFSNGKVNLNTNISVTCIDVRTSGTSYVIFDSGITVDTTGGSVNCTNFIGCWSSGSTYRLGLHADAKINHAGTKIWQHGIAKTLQVLYFDTATVNIDGVDKNVFIATGYKYNSNKTTSIMTTDLTVDNGDGTKSLPAITVPEGAEFVTGTETVNGYDWAFTKATYTDAEGTVHTIYYQVIE